MRSRTKPIIHRTDNESPLPLPALVFPRLLRIQDAAKYLSATTWQIETLLREGEIPSFILGKRRVVDRLELDRFVERRNHEMQRARSNNVAVAGPASSTTTPDDSG